MQIQDVMQVTVGNNYYENIKVLKDNRIFYFFSEKTDLKITNETLIGNTLDDLYSVGAAKNLVI